MRLDPKPQILLIDNYDSFAHNLGRYAALAGAQVHIERNDGISLSAITQMKPDGIILSPGPCAPQDAGICIDLIRTFGAHIPILGVCLGHQAIGEAYGGKTIKADAPMHGRTSLIRHDQTCPLFKDIPQDFSAARYHSLIADIQDALDLVPIANTADDNVLMAMRHDTHPVYGIQFHPESILTHHGQQIIQNFVQLMLS